MHQRFEPAAWTLTFAIGAALCTTVAQARSRGELLYSTHCISCHTTEIHWRDNREATNWTTLRFQVDRWQGESGQKQGAFCRWREQDDGLAT